METLAQAGNCISLDVEEPTSLLEAQTESLDYYPAGKRFSVCPNMNWVLPTYATADTR